MQLKNDESISISLPSYMLETIQREVTSGSYDSPSELIRDAMRLWMKREEEYIARISLLREHLKHSGQNGATIALDDNNKHTEMYHRIPMNMKHDERV